MKKILIVSDLHVGSTSAIMPPIVELGPTATRLMPVTGRRSNSGWRNQMVNYFSLTLIY